MHKRAVGIGALALLFSTQCFATEICTVGAGIGNDDGKFTYMTGIGPNGADENPMKPATPEIKNILAVAAEKSDPGTMYCMTGEVKKHVFVVTAVKPQTL